ncbi:hypothetical protein [Haloplanus salinus]|jgi:hypothetical protein|uniref:hypothetical protein n=1 Tax=Haloplanus salinus TaxID=1126245 RepID=UPI0015F03642|nr:hypothetical protein [Haloplanus salinus]
MDRQRLVVGVHVVVALGLFAFGVYRLSLGRVVPGGLNVVMAAAIAVAGVYMGRFA